MAMAVIYYSHVNRVGKVHVLSEREKRREEEARYPRENGAMRVCRTGL